MAKQKATELPIYVKKDKEDRAPEVADGQKSNPVEPYVADVRHQIVSVLHPQVGEYVNQVEDAMAGVCQQVSNLRELVREDAVAEATFITSAVFFGYMIGRKSYFRRLFYATGFGAAAWAWAEPKQFRDYTEVARDLAKQKGHELFQEMNGPDYLEQVRQFFKQPFSSSSSSASSSPGPDTETKKSN